MPSSIKDRLTNSWEYVYFFTKSKKYFFDLDAIREKQKFPEDVERRIKQDALAEVKPFMKGSPQSRHGWQYNIREGEPHGVNPRDIQRKKGLTLRELSKMGIDSPPSNISYPLGKNPGDVFQIGQVEDFWSITTKPFLDAHFAVFPEELCKKPIRAGCPQLVCSKCGMPKRIEKIVGGNTNVKSIRVRDVKEGRIKGSDRVATEWEVNHYQEKEYISSEKKVVQWGCNCNAEFIPGTVLDPFAGSGTVGLVALKERRNAILIELKPEYCEMIKKRLNWSSPFFEKEFICKISSKG